MLRSAPPLRLLRLLALVIHLLVPGAVGIADANHVGPADGVPHVESQNHDCEDPAHGESCLLLHVLRSAAIIGDPPQISLSVPPVSRAESAPVVVLGRQPATLALPRGPPSQV